MTRWAADNLDFMGPVSGLLNAAVGRQTSLGQRPTMSYQGDLRTMAGAGTLRASQPFEVAAFNNVIGSSPFIAGPGSMRASGGESPLFLGSTANRLVSAGGGVDPLRSVVGSYSSSISDLAKNFLRKGSLLDGTDGIPTADLSNLKGDLSSVAQAFGVASADQSLDAILSSSSEASSPVGSVASAIAAESNSAFVSRQTAGGANGEVPLPASALLLGLGLLGFVAAQRKNVA